MDKCLDKNKKKAARVVSNFHIVCYPIKRKKNTFKSSTHLYCRKKKKKENA